MGLSKRQIILQYGFNSRLVETLLDRGVLTILPECTPLRPKIDPLSVGNLVEDEHYVVCQECGAFQAQVTTKHLRVCSGLTLAEYLAKHGGAVVLSSLSSGNKAKSEEQRTWQSRVLKHRFTTPAGEATRQRIGEASRQLHASGYREIAATHLRAVNADPQQRKDRGEESKARWATVEHREKIQRWQELNREAVLKSAAYARRHIQRKRSKLHLGFKQAMLDADIQGFVTEHEVGYYAIDEARPDIKVAVEVDGCYWHGCKVCGFAGMPNIKNLDRRKTTYLTRRGWVVLRITEHDIHKNIESCVQEVVQAVSDARQRGVA